MSKFNYRVKYKTSDDKWTLTGLMKRHTAEQVAKRLKEKGMEVQIIEDDNG